MTTLTREQIAYVMQFAHPEKTNAALPGARDTLDDTVLGALFGLDAATYRAIRTEFDETARQAASELLAGEAFAALVDRLPFARRSTVIGLGDSITDDYQSWLEILRHVLAMRRPQDGITVVNAGVSSDTATQVISRFLDIVNQQPDWIICMIGTNHARRHGLSATAGLVSPEETARNLAMLRQIAATQTAARWVWMTPATVDEEQIASHWWIGPLQVMFRNDDLAAVADVIRRQPEPVVDLQQVFGLPPRRDLLLDGLHPSLAGQQAIVTALVEHLAAG